MSPVTECHLCLWPQRIHSNHNHSMYKIEVCTRRTTPKNPAPIFVIYHGKQRALHRWTHGNNIAVRESIGMRPMDENERKEVDSFHREYGLYYETPEPLIIDEWKITQDRKWVKHLCDQFKNNKDSKSLVDHPELQKILDHIESAQLCLVF